MRKYAHGSQIINFKSYSQPTHSKVHNLSNGILFAFPLPTHLVEDCWILGNISHILGLSSKTKMPTFRSHELVSTHVNEYKYI